MEINSSQGSFSARRLFSVETILSFVVVVGVLFDYYNNIRGRFSSFDASVGIAPYAFFMAGASFVALIFLFVRLLSPPSHIGWIWFALGYIFFAFLSTALSGRYDLQRLPFRFVELFYWLAVMSLCYFAVLQIGTSKFHLFIAAIFIPLLCFTFYIVREKAIATADVLYLNPVFYICFMTPAVLLLRSVLIKATLLVFIFIAILLSYKRMALFGFFTSLIAYFYCYLKIHPASRAAKIAIVSMASILFAGLLFYVYRYVGAAFGLDWSARLEGLLETGGAGRTAIWGQIVKTWLDSPSLWLLGGGKGAVSQDIRWAHNDILEILYDFGVIGLIFYFLFAIYLLRRYFEMARFHYPFLGAYAASLVWAFWGGMTDVFLNYPYHFLAIAFFWGVCFAEFELFKQQQAMSSQDFIFEQTHQEFYSEEFG